MNIKKVPVDIYVEYAYCDCGERMIKDNIVLTSYPCQYKYKCPKCGKIETSYEQYPKVRY